MGITGEPMVDDDVAALMEMVVPYFATMPVRPEPDRA
jgi:hypothetical protein